MAKMKEGSAAYNDEAIQLALARMDIRPCKKCGHPTEVGYCCGHCGSADGTDDDQEMYVSYKALRSI